MKNMEKNDFEPSPEDMEQNNKPTDTENTDIRPEPETPTLDTFDLEALIMDGEAVFDDTVKFYSPKTRRVEVMPIQIRPVVHSDWNRAARAASRKDSDKNVEESIVALGWVEDENSVPVQTVPLSKIRRIPKGVVSQVYEKIKLISGQFEDRMEEKLVEKLTNF